MPYKIMNLWNGYARVKNKETGNFKVKVSKTTVEKAKTQIKLFNWMEKISLVYINTKKN